MKKPYLKPESIVYALAYEAVLLTGTNFHTSGGTQSNTTEELNIDVSNADRLPKRFEPNAKSFEEASDFN
ncbi:MAG: hypothetical protein HXO12_03885 [Prevotella salivae]|nr:hypothetical protein [Segatella salivae]